MTAEIAILSRKGVALAADSAFTRGNKVSSGNKLFSFSPTNDIGVMIFGSADFIGFPWEILIKTFRQKTGQDEFSSVKECAEKFIAYLKCGDFRDSDAERLSVQLVVVDALERVTRRRDQIGGSASISGKTFKVVRAMTKSLIENKPQIESSPKLDDFKKEFEEDCLELAKDVLGIDCADKPRNKATLLKFLHTVISHEAESAYSTGIVFAGYGSDQLFPELISYTVDGKHDGYFRIWESQSQNLNDIGNSGAIIIPFAQSDMFQVFMEGIARGHHVFVDETLRRLLQSKSSQLIKAYVTDVNEKKVEAVLQERENQVIIEEFHKEFQKHIHESMVQPVMQVLEGLPKEELAAMAEALVEITSLRRKVDSQVETVGGPTDVALISKGDGIVWIKRKHYFSAEMNQDFVLRKMNRHRGTGKNA